ncbi:MAG: hypothetical protein ACK55I_21110, partial [bacterium]
GVGLDEERPPGGKGGELPRDEGLVTLRVLEQVEMHRLVGDRHVERLADVRPQGLEVADDAVLLGQWEVGVDHELAGLHLGSARQFRGGVPRHDRRGLQRGGVEAGSDGEPRAAAGGTGQHGGEQAARQETVWGCHGMGRRPVGRGAGC